MKVPCEIILWHLLPSIRKEFAKCLKDVYGLNQKQIAELLGITPAAVCQYLSAKRGYFEITDDEIITEIKKSTDVIFQNGLESIVEETCRVCIIIKSKGIIEKVLIQENRN